MQVVNTGGSVVLGIRANGDIDILPGVWLSLSAGPGGTWNISTAVQNISNAKFPPVLSGPVPQGGIAPGTWHTLRALANGTIVTFSLDDEVLIALNTSSVSSPGFPLTGWLGIGSLQWSDVTWFDNVTVTGIPDTCALEPAPVHTNITLKACNAENGNALLTWVSLNSTDRSGQLGLWSSGGTLCLGTWGVYAHTGAPNVATVPCNASDSSQVWVLENNATSQLGPLLPSRLLNAATGQCLEYPGQAAFTGIRVETWACHSGPAPPDGNQLWLFDSSPTSNNGSVLQSVLASGLCASACQ